MCKSPLNKWNPAYPGDPRVSGNLTTWAYFGGKVFFHYTLVAAYPDISAFVSKQQFGASNDQSIRHLQNKNNFLHTQQCDKSI